MATRLFFPVFILGLNDALQPWPFSCSADPLTMTATSALFSHHVAPIDALFQSHGLFSFFFCSLPGALQSAQTSVLCSFLDISKVDETKRWMSAMMWIFARLPPPPELQTDVCRQPMRPLNPRKPGGMIGFSPGQLTTTELPVNSSGLFAHVRWWTPRLDPSYVNIVNLFV